MSEKKHLGVEFYRNFVGIEKPLKIQDDKLQVYDFAHIDKNGNLLLEGDEWDYDANFIECKPYLRTIEDLSDEELLAVFESTKDKHVIARNKSYIFMEDKKGKTIIAFSLATSQFIDSHIVDEKFYSNMRELHCDPRAKEYIDNGLAWRVEK